MNPNQTEKFRALLEDFPTAVLITHGRDTHFHARPMVIARVDDSCDLWFLTGEDSAKVHEITADTRVQVVCQKGFTCCLSVAGRASLSRDHEEIRDLWKPIYQTWFPKGVDDPEVVLIHVAGEQGEYWDNTGANRLTYAYRAIKAALTHSTPEITEGNQHGRVTF